MNLAKNISQLWISSDYYEKQKLQHLLFPQGILHDKKNDRIRTNSVNTLFRVIAVQERVLGETKNDNPFLDCHFGSNVGMITGSSNFLEDIITIISSTISLITKNE
jgi:hypothetical protein